MALNTYGLTQPFNLLNATANPTDRQPGFFVYDAGADNVATVKGAGYFNAVRGRLTVDSLILAVCNDGFRILRVATVPASGNVTTTELTGAAA